MDNQGEPGVLFLLGQLDGKVTSILTHLTGLSQRIEALNLEVNNHESRLATLEAHGKNNLSWVSYLISGGAFIAAVFPYIKELIQH